MKSTPDVAKELGMPLSRLHNLLQLRKLAKPPQKFGGRLAWMPADVERAKQQLAQLPDYRPRKED